MSCIRVGRKEAALGMDFTERVFVSVMYMGESFPVYDVCGELVATAPKLV